MQNLAYGSGVGGSRSRDVQNLAYGSGAGGSRSRDVQNLAYLISSKNSAPLIIRHLERRNTSV